LKLKKILENSLSDSLGRQFHMMDLKDNSLFLEVNLFTIRLDINQSQSLHSTAKQETFCFIRGFILWASYKDFLLTQTMIMLQWFIKTQSMVFLFWNAILLLGCAYLHGSMYWNINGIILLNGNHSFIQFSMEKIIGNREKWRISGGYENSSFGKNWLKLSYLFW